MFNPIVTAKIFSQLGNSSSLLPIAIKDAAHSAGMTTSSYITGKEVEGKDRLIDEFGTQAIWIGGIPFYKKVIDLTLFKLAKHNPKIDTRLFKDEAILQKAYEHAPTEEIKKSIAKVSKNAAKVIAEQAKKTPQEIAEAVANAAKNQKTFKGLALAKFIAATALTLGSYAGLTTFRHKHTEKNIIKEIKKEEQAKKEEAFKGKQAQKIGSKPSFGGMNMAGLKDFMFDPVKNMMIVDGGITTERLAESRNPQDFMGYVIKEGSFWFFMYFAGEQIQKFFEKRANTKHNKSIDLDIRALQDNKLKNYFKSGKAEASIKEFQKMQKPEEIYEFLCTNHNNLVVKMAKKSGIVKTYKKTGLVDTQQYIDIDAVKGVGEKLEKLYKQYQVANVSGEKIEDFISKTIKLKRGSILKNIGTCMGVLGVVVPGIMLAMRYMDKDNKEFAVKKQLQEKIQKQNIIA